ncbi:MAG: GNAT family N-acetyltransferase [Pseudonocardia sp.]
MSEVTIHPVELACGPVRLREFAASDLDRVHALVGDDAVAHTLSFDTRSRQQAESMLTGVLDRARHHPRTEYYLAICRNSDGLLVGFVRLGLGDVRAAKLGYAVHREHWRQGYAHHASRMMIDFGFQKLGLHRISAAVGPDNTASLTGLDKHGFTFEGRIRDHVFTNGAWRDSLLYSLLEPEWASSTAVSRES